MPDNRARDCLALSDLQPEVHARGEEENVEQTLPQMLSLQVITLSQMELCNEPARRAGCSLSFGMREADCVKDKKQCTRESNVRGDDIWGCSALVALLPSR